MPDQPTGRAVGALNVERLAATMTAAALAVLKNQTPQLREYAANEFEKIARAIVRIEAQAAVGAISGEEAMLHLEIQRSASRTVLLTVKGLGLLEAEDAINAALGAVRDTVNAALPFPLL